MVDSSLVLDNLTRDSGFFLRFTEEILSFRSPYQEVKLVQSDTYGRVLLLDGKVQSTEVDEFIYHEALVHPAMLSHPRPRSVYIAGGGEGATLREVLKYPCVEEVVMVDLDREVVQLCRDQLPSWHQGAFADSRVRMVYEDARDVLEREKKKYDVIICDLSEPVDEGPSYMLFTQEFYRLCRERLHTGGILVTQSGCPSFVYSVSFHSVTATLQSVFTHAHPYLAFIPSFASNWGFTMSGDTLLLPAMSQAEITSRFLPLGDQLRYLDETFVASLFSIPKHLRDTRKEVGRIIRDGEPLIVI